MTGGREKKLDGCGRHKMIKAWRQWKTRTDLSSGLFLKLYIWDRIIIRPRRRARRRRFQQ